MPIPTRRALRASAPRSRMPADRVGAEADRRAPPRTQPGPPGWPAPERRRGGWGLDVESTTPPSTHRDRRGRATRRRGPSAATVSVRPLALIAGALLIAACAEDASENLDPYRAPPAPPRPGCRTIDVVAIPVGNNPGYAAVDAALAAGRVPADHVVDVNQAFGGRDLDIAGACCDEDLCVDASLATVPDLVVPGPNAVLQVSLVTGLKAQERPEAARTLVLAVDASGSLLSRQTIGHVKAALHDLVDAVEDDARVGLVTFDARPHLAVPVGSASEVRDQIHGVVDALEAGGGTNLSAGLQAAFLEATRVFDPSREHRVLLVTDGNDPRSQQDASLIARDLLPFHAQGVQLTVFGVGGEDEQAWLRPLTDSADGRFLEDDGAEGLTGLVMDELSRRYVPVATEVELRVRPPDGAAFGQHAGWAPPVRGDGILRAQLSAVLLGPDGEMITPGQGREGGPAIVVDLEPTGAEASDSADVVLNYNPVGEGARATYRAYVDLPEGWPAIEGFGLTDSLAAREALLARHIGETIAQSADLWARGQKTEALRLIAKLEAVLEDYPDGADGPDADVVRDLARVNQLRRRMEGLTSGRPDPDPEDPWPGAR